ncbi:MAG TPA: hypothetical protein VJZ27_08395 [Aggregatilineales bacterium]|nr:hypothetical protein [Aggregatilineales bacterium]
MTTFLEKWRNAQKAHHSRLAIGLAPRIVDMPAPIARYDDPFLPFGRAIINATAEFACAFVFDLASYLAIGAAGAVALERSIPLVPRELPVILHAPFVTADFAKAAFEDAFAVDAVTLATGKLEVVRAYTENENHAAFVNTRAAMSPGGGSVGFFDETGFEFDGVRVLWVTDEIIYAAGTLDFENAVRSAAEHYRRESLKP